ncbi:hypothetical protein F4811DRAFT_269213 [Daldinia bambusicola]|nr:hypothetical protein F4811DRAFT_269213 [Daldinia bambusicola]
MTPIPLDQQRNYEIFRDCLSTALIEKISRPEPKPKRRTKSRKATKLSSSPASKKEVVPAANADADPDPDANADVDADVDADGDGNGDLNNADDLADFSDYIATETFRALPSELKTIDFHGYSKDPALQARFSSSSSSSSLPLTGADTPLLLPSLDPAVADSLSAYGITREPAQGVDEFLAPVLTSFLSTLGTRPRPPRATLSGAEGCEMCARDWVPLSYHHLIPRFVHAKAVRRGWHRAEDLGNVAWLCGACHRFVHGFKGHEDLARRYYTVDLLMAEEPVRRWAEWVGRLRWKGR